MILKASLLVIFCSVWFKRVTGEPYKVYKAADPVPVQYLNYGAPAVQLVSPQLARLTSAPSGSVVPLSQISTFTPCILPPCILPVSSPAIAVQPENARILLKTPKTTKVEPPKDEPSSYQYSYVVYDENTGDQKAQRELSDGVVVRGEYSLIQPDGLVREVQYTADDVKGFQAVVKNFLPEDAKKKDNANPCPEVKSEALKEKTVIDKPVDSIEVKPTNSTALNVAPVEVPKTIEVKAVENVPSVEALVEKTPVIENKPKPDEQVQPANIAVVPGTSIKEIQAQFDERDAAAAQKISLYGDVLKCIEAAVKARTNGEKGTSPLTYILLPYNKC